MRLGPPIQVLRNSSNFRLRTLAPLRCIIRPYTANRDPIWNALSLCLLLLPSCSLHLRAQAGATQASSLSVPEQSLYKSGMLLVQQGRLDDAIETFKRGYRLDPSNVVLLNAIGSTYCLKDDTHEAEGYFLKALSTDPQFTPARRNLGITYFNSGKYDLAKAQFEELSRSAVNDPSPSLFLGMIAKRNGQYCEAVEFFEKSGDLAFQYPDLILSFAQFPP